MGLRVQSLINALSGISKNKQDTIPTDEDVQIVRSNIKREKNTEEERMSYKKEGLGKNLS